MCHIGLVNMHSAKEVENNDYELCCCSVNSVEVPCSVMLESI